MGKFTVIANDTFAGEVRDIKRIECHSIGEAFRELGNLAANHTGVIIIDEHDCVWHECRPNLQFQKMTPEQRRHYQHYEKG